MCKWVTKLKTGYERLKDNSLQRCPKHQLQLIIFCENPPIYRQAISSDDKPVVIKCSWYFENKSKA